MKVILEGVTVLIGPLDKDSWDAKDVQARRLGIKRAWLKKTEEEALKKKDKVEDDSKKVRDAECPPSEAFVALFCVLNRCRVRLPARSLRRYCSGVAVRKTRRTNHRIFHTSDEGAV